MILSFISFSKVRADVLNHTCDHISDAKLLTSSCIEYDDNSFQYYLNSGDYYLNEDILDLGDANDIQIKSGETVNICLNGHIINAYFEVYGELNIYDCQETEHKYTKDNKFKYVLDENNGNITVKGGAIYGMSMGQRNGGAFYVKEGATLNLTNVNIIGNDAVNGSAIFAEKGSVYCKNVNILGNSNDVLRNYSDPIRSGAALVCIDSDVVLENTNIKDNTLLDDIDINASSVYISGQNNKTVLLKGNTTIKDNYVRIPTATDNVFDLRYSGLTVDPNGNNLLDVEDGFSGYVEVEVFDYVNKSTYTNKLLESTLTKNLNNNYLANFSLTGSKNFSSYYLNSNNNQISILYRIKQQPSVTNGYKYDVKENGYNVEYQWYEKTKETVSIDNYINKIQLGEKTANGYKSAFNFRIGALIGIELKDLEETDATISFKSTSNDIYLDKNTYKLGDTYYIKQSGNNLSIYLKRDSTETEFEITDVKVIKDKLTAITGQTTSTLTSRTIGSYICKASMKNGQNIDKVHTSEVTDIITLINEDKGDCKVISSTNGSANYPIGKTQDTALHIKGIYFDEIKENSTSSDGSNPFENIKVNCNGSELTYNSDYVLEEGSIKVILLKSFLDTLAKGNNEISVSLITNIETYEFKLNVIINDGYKVVNTSVK